MRERHMNVSCDFFCLSVSIKGEIVHYCVRRCVCVRIMEEEGRRRERERERDEREMLIISSMYLIMTTQAYTCIVNIHFFNVATCTLSMYMYIYNVHVRVAR